MYTQDLPAIMQNNHELSRDPFIYNNELIINRNMLRLQQRRNCDCVKEYLVSDVLVKLHFKFLMSIVSSKDTNNNNHMDNNIH